MIDLEKPLEGVDYTLIPIAIIDDENAWQVQILRGKYADNYFVFTGIEYNGKTQQLKFKLDVVKDNEWVAADQSTQDYAFDILTDIIRKGIVDGSLVINDKDSSN
jgi:hypothetical protein